MRRNVFGTGYRKPAAKADKVGKKTIMKPKQKAKPKAKPKPSTSQSAAKTHGAINSVASNAQPPPEIEESESSGEGEGDWCESESESDSESISESTSESSSSSDPDSDSDESSVSSPRTHNDRTIKVADVQPSSFIPQQAHSQNEDSDVDLDEDPLDRHARRIEEITRKPAKPSSTNKSRSWSQISHLNPADFTVYTSTPIRLQKDAPASLKRAHSVVFISSDSDDASVGQVRKSGKHAKNDRPIKKTSK